MSSTAALVIIAVSALVIYMFATKDNQYVFIRDRPVQPPSKRQSINYYAWQGPFFVENSMPLEGTVENFNNFSGSNNPKNEVVPTCHPCEIPKYNMNNPKAKKCHKFAMNQCRVRTQTSEMGWKNEYWNSQHRMEGPSDGLSRKLGGPGNFAQTTNNNLDFPNNLPSAQMRSVMGDWFADEDKVSPFCYAETYKACMME